MKRVLAALGVLVFAYAGAPSASAQTPAAAPAAATDPAKEELRAYLEGYMSWGKGQVSLIDLMEHKVPGWKLVRAVKKFDGREGDGEQLEAALDEAGKTALIGVVFVDEERAGKDMPVATARDLEGVSVSLKRVFGPTRFKLSLDPSTDLPGWKGAKVGIDTGYGFYEAPAHVSAHDGGFVVLGRVWDRSRSIPEQRRATIPLTDTPFIGDADAKITVVEYSDMQCPSCKFRTAMWEKLTEKLGSAVKIKRYFKSYPLTSIHSWAFRAASAGRCFFEKDPALFLSWKGAVYGRQEQLSVDALDAFAFDFAQSNGTTSQDFLGCYLQPAATNRILKDLGEGFGMGVRSTPTYFVDGVLVTWWDEDTMEEFLRTKYMNGAGLPLPTKPKPTPAPAH